MSSVAEKLKFKLPAVASGYCTRPYPTLWAETDGMILDQDLCNSCIWVIGTELGVENDSGGPRCTVSSSQWVRPLQSSLDVGAETLNQRKEGAREWVGRRGEEGLGKRG